jgi:hypothetical protein
VLHPFAKKSTPNWQTDLLHQIGKPIYYTKLANRLPTFFRLKGQLANRFTTGQSRGKRKWQTNREKQ